MCDRIVGSFNISRIRMWVTDFATMQWKPKAIDWWFWFIGLLLVRAYEYHTEQHIENMWFGHRCERLTQIGKLQVSICVPTANSQHSNGDRFVAEAKLSPENQYLSLLRPPPQFSIILSRANQKLITAATQNDFDCHLSETDFQNSCWTNRAIEVAACGLLKYWI